MSRFNTKQEEVTIVNRAGGQAYAQSPKLELVSILLTSFVQDQSYRTQKDTIAKIKALIPLVGEEFAAKAAVYARKTFGMRSISHVVAGELCKSVSGQAWMKDFLNAVVKRPDDILEISSYYDTRNNKVTNAMRKGFGKALTRFDEYQISKYKAKNKNLSLVDAVNIYHPRNTDALRALVKGTLKSANTWESNLSEVGKLVDTENKTEEQIKEEKKELKADAWKKLLAENKLGQMALLKNLRNIIEVSDDRTFSLALSQLVDESRVKKSMILPFRYVTAYEEIQKLNTKRSRETLQYLSRSVDIACSCVPSFPGETLVVLDTSGSMNGEPIRIGSLFASILMKASNADYMEFSGSAQYVNKYDLNDSVLSIAQRIEKSAVFGGTNFRDIFKKTNKPYDRVIILSDMQGWIGYRTPKQEFHDYKRKYNCNPNVYSFDLAGYGDMQFPEDKVFCVAGFSEKVFDMFEILEQDKNALVHTIEKVDF